MLKKEFTQKTIDILRKRAGEMCTICKRLTSIPHSNPEKSISLGEAAHISGKMDSPNKRFNPTLSIEEIANISNGIWLCRECHKKIDSDDKYSTVQYLNETKKQHESDLVSGKLNYTKFIEYQKLEYQIYYLTQELNNKKDSQLAKELEEAEKEKQQFKERIHDIEQTLLDTKYPLEKAKKCFFELNDLNATLNIINEDNSIIEEEIIAQKRLLIAQVKEAQGKNDEAEINYKKSIQIYAYLENLFLYGKFLYVNGQYTEAVKNFKRIVGPDNDESVKKTKLDYKTIHILNRTCLFLSEIFQNFNDIKSASQYINNALEFQKYLIDRNPKEIDFHINTLSMQGNLLIKTGQYEYASKFYKRALELTELIFQPNSRERASCLANLGINYYNLNDEINAKKNLTEALNIFEELHNTNEENKNSLAKLYSWLSRLATGTDYCNKALKLYTELSEQNPKKYLRDKIISQIDLANSLDNFLEKESIYQNIFSQEEDFLKIDRNLYEPLLANAYRIFALDLNSNNKSKKALLTIVKSVQMLVTITERNENYFEDLIIALNFKIDLLLKDKSNNIENLKKDINLFKSIMDKRIFKSKDFVETFELRLKYCLEEIKK